MPTLTRGEYLATVGVATAATPQLLATVNAVRQPHRRRVYPTITPENYAGVCHPTLSANAVSVATNDKSGRTCLISRGCGIALTVLNIDYSLSYSNAATYCDISHNNGKYDSRPKGTVTMRLPNIGWTVDRTRDPIVPTITQTEGPDIYNLNNYSTLLLAQNDRRGFDTVVSGKFDLKKDLPLALPAFVKTGFTYQTQSRKLWGDSRRYNYAGADGIFGTADDNRDLGQFTDTTGYHRMDEKVYGERGGAPVWPNPYAVAQLQKQYPELWKEDIAFGARARVESLRLITENIAAVYLMGNIRLDKVSVLGGVRVENTRVSGEGPLSYISPAERARRAAWVGAVTDAEARRRVEAEFGGRSKNKGQYRSVFPGLHLKYEPFDGLVTRLSWSTGVGVRRSARSSPTPRSTTAPRVTMTNPDLKPQYSDNYDFSAEYYFQPQGMLSVGAFRKRSSITSRRTAASSWAPVRTTDSMDNMPDTA